MQTEAVLGAGRLQLERLRRRLNAPGALATQLGQLQQEAELQGVCSPLGWALHF